MTGDFKNRLSARPAAAAKNSLPSWGRDTNQVRNAYHPVDDKRGREGGVDDTFPKEKFAHAFGAPLLNSAGDNDTSDTHSLW